MVSLAGAQQAEPEADFRAYPVHHVDLATARRQLEAVLGSRQGVEVFPDEQGSRLLVRGGQQVQQLVGQMLAQIDVPVTAAPVQAPQPEPTPGPGELKSYPLDDDTRPVLQQWRAQFADQDDIRIAFDQRTSQALVYAPEEVQQQIDQSLSNPGEQDSIRIVNGDREAQQQPDERTSSDTSSADRLQQLSGEQLHRRLEKAFGRPLPASWDDSRTWYRFQTEPGASGVKVAVHRDTGEVRFEGPDTQVDDWQRVITTLDKRPSNEFPVTGLVATEGKNRQRVRRAVQVLLASNRNADQQDRQAAPGAVTPPQGNTTAVVGADEALASLLGPVDLVFVEGLDVILIRGSEEDVARVREIIAEIEQATGETLPEVVVHPLQNVDSIAMAALLQRIYTEVLGPRTGDVHITPLGKPNSLLLIGRKDNIDRAVELVNQLDQPVDPSTRFQVFTLQHASALDVKPLVDQLLAGPPDQEDDDDIPSLRPTGLVVTDFRTNSLIISASPRELAEIKSLIKKVDVGVSESRDQLRVFPLSNTVASEMATVLRQAIQPSAAPPGGDDDGDTDEVSSGRAASLELLTIDAEQETPIQSGVLTNVRVTAEPRTNSLVITAPTESMPLIEALINQLDTAPDVQAQVKVFTMENGDAEALAETLRELFGAEDDPTEVGGVGAGETSLVPLQLSVDRRTNTIVVAGSAADLEVVEAILFRLDGGDVRERVTEVVRLKNATAEAVANTIQSWLESRQTAEQEAELEISPFEQIEREVIVVPEIVSNSLVVSATPRYIEEVRKVINDLDQRPPMVMIQVMIAEVRLGEADEFGVELGLQDSLLFDRSLLQDFQTIQRSSVTTNDAGATIATVTEDIIVNSPMQPGYNFNSSPQGSLGNNGSATSLANAGKVAAQGLSNFALNRVNQDLGFSGLVLSASSNAVNMLLRALKENRRTEILSRPQIMAMDGREGSVVLGEEVPIIRGVSLTDFAQNNTIEYRPVGLILNVLPHINPDGLVVMDILAEKSEVGDLSQGIPVSIVDGQPINAPRINNVRAITTVSALSGQTVVLSGLLTKDTVDIHRRVPIIADIPLLGDLFRYDRVVEERTELLIILTPRVVNSQLDAERIKQVESSRMSWVLSDVINMHGSSGLRSRCDEWYEGESESVYPTYVPNDGEVVPYYEEVPATEGPALDEPAPQQPSGLGSNQQAKTDSNVRPTAYGEPVRLPPAN